jgi:hypothetical protein
VYDLKNSAQSIFTEEVREMSNNSGGRNKLVVQGAEQALDQMKYEIAQEFGVQLGPEASARANGSVGGEITKRLVQMAESQMRGTSGQ